MKTPREANPRDVLTNANGSFPKSDNSSDDVKSKADGSLDAMSTEEEEEYITRQIQQLQTVKCYAVVLGGNFF